MSKVKGSARRSTVSAGATGGRRRAGEVLWAMPWLLCSGVFTAALPSAQVLAAGEIQEILVTARKRTESIQDIPVAVTAFDASALSRLGADDLEDVGVAVPNLNLVQGRGSSASANVFIRGMGQPDALQTFDPAVGIYLDGVYIPRIQGALFKLFDVERLEVLRGPQGTLYGKNTMAGAINIVTRQPSEIFTGQAEISAGNYDRREGKFYLSGPLVDGLLAGSVSALVTRRDGFVADPVNGRDYNDDDTRAGRLNLVATPADDLRLSLSADVSRQRTALTMGRAEAPLVQVDLGTGAVTPLHIPPAGEFDYTASTSFDGGEGQELDSYGVALTVDWDLGRGAALKSITAYRDLEFAFHVDIDATVFELGDVFVPVDQDQVSQEFQLNLEGEDWSGVFGAYYLREEFNSDQRAFGDDLFTFFGLPTTVLTSVQDAQITTSYALFGHLDYQLSEEFTVSTGVRFTREEKDYEYRRADRLNGALFSAFAFADEEDWDAVTPSLTLEYEWGPALMSYASVARGFKSGGFNGRANADAEREPFDPEKVWAYELGVKSAFDDGATTLNLALFYNDYEDFQARVTDRTAGAGVTFALPVLNAGELETSGLELELASSPVDNLSVFAALGYLDASYKEFADARGDRSDDVVPFAPEWTGRVGAAYTLALAAGSLEVGADASFKSDHYLSVDNQEVLTQDDFWLYNAYLRYDADHWYLVASVKNIGDEVYKTDGQEFSNVANAQTAYYGDPRTYGMTLGVRF